MSKTNSFSSWPILRQEGWHCCQYDIDPTDHPGCDLRDALGCKGCEYAIWRITSRMAAETDQPQEGETVQ